MTEITWTKPYRGINHSSRMPDGRWASIIRRSIRQPVVLALMSPNSGEALTQEFNTVCDATLAAEAWLTSPTTEAS